MPKDLTLHFGFVQTPYTSETRFRPATSAKAAEKLKRKRGFRSTMTADKLANILEAKYNIVHTFSEVHDEDIRDIINNGFKEVAERMILERKGHSKASLKNLMKSATRQVEELFKAFLDNEEMNGRVEGVPSKAATKGKLGGRGRITRSGIARPTFVNTGIYKNSFRAWIK
ncbi:MAG TPA: hypothetical protein VK890_01260 [Bacteroidia bacterium]|jgi:hypothetical protein|nr:hypothetical protein [Bacteroidia bacterium]